MRKYFKQRQTGFTIVEILIVVGLIAAMLMVIFLAVPALKRNSRNYRMQTDATAILTGVKQYFTQNEDWTTFHINGPGPDIKIYGDYGEQPVFAKVGAGLVVTDRNNPHCGTSFLPGLQANTIVWSIYCQCSPNRDDFIDTNKPEVVILYPIEHASSPLTYHCLQK